VLIPVPTYLGESMDKKLGKTARAAGGASYYVEACLACAVFCLIGGKVTFSSYIEDYIADTGCIYSKDKSLALAILWFAITMGRLGGLADQIRVENKGQLYNHLYLWLVTGALGMGLLLTFPSSAVAAWFGFVLYGFGNGPCVGYCYDINNRITVPSEVGMSIVMFGLNFGASIVPYLTAMAWKRTGQPYWLTINTFLTMVLLLQTSCVYAFLFHA
jgi:fucose permease